MAYNDTLQPPANSVYRCVCPEPYKPEPTLLFGCTMPGFLVCGRCERPVVTMTAAPEPPSRVSSSPGRAMELAAHQRPGATRR